MTRVEEPQLVEDGTPATEAEAEAWAASSLEAVVSCRDALMGCCVEVVAAGMDLARETVAMVSAAMVA